MRVLTYTSLYPNKVNPLQGIFIHQRVKHLGLRSGNSVEVIAPIPYFPSWLPSERWRQFSQIPREETMDGVRIHHPRYPLLPGISMPVHGMLMYLASVSLARRLHSENQFDCIDAHFVYPDGFAAVRLGRKLSLPVVVSARGSDVNLYPSFRTIRPMLRWTLTHAAGAIAVSADLKNKMIALGIPETNIQVISNGVDVERFQPRDAKSARKQLGLPEERAILVSAGSLIESKGHHLLIAAVAELARSFPQLRLYILGEGVYRSTLEQLVREKKVQDRVFFFGNRPNEELNLWFSAADLSCLISSREGWPNVVSEALACGTPVLATRAGGIPEIITSPELGLFVERNVQSIAVGLERALTKPWNRAEIARHSRSRSWDEVAAEVEAFLQSTIPSR
ncbi:MAG TPA: glycosyltransferase family 4 protein [Candidatus Acidoferrum sp.]|nr:glycosyltransferase family 4 protein [Candidatus Acidoferrum sp.]